MQHNLLHSQSLITANAERSRAFLEGVLGLRLVKRTVYRHNPRLLHYFFGFGPAAGAAEDPFAFISCVEWDPIFYDLDTQTGFTEPADTQEAWLNPRVGDPRGRWGVGGTHHLALQVAERNGLLKWKRRLTDHGVHVSGPYDRNYFQSIYFRDGDGALLEIATAGPGFAHDEEILGSAHRSAPDAVMVGARGETQIAAETWPRPVREITPDMELAGFHHVTAVASDNERTAEFFTGTVGLQLIKKTDYMDAPNATHYYFAGPDPAPGSVLTFFGFPGHEPARLGIGQPHHFAFAVADDAELTTWYRRLEAAGVESTAIQDFTYYRTFFFRDPDGHICAAATPPQFTVDEPRSELGRNLCLPDDLEPRRAELELQTALKPAPAAAQAIAAVS
jgi:catechol 2,3-dioxygenase-like lactoylglutathione lyase family enzyme